MSNSWKCPHCGGWIGSMQVHEDCARKQDERDQVTADDETTEKVIDLFEALKNAVKRGAQ